MPIQLPDLENVTYDDLTREAIASIPKYTREWTNFNPSDPGITLLELLAWVSEALVYRCSRVPHQQYITFLRLVVGRNAVTDHDPVRKKLLELVEALENKTAQVGATEIKAAAQVFLNSSYRAVTAEDFRNLALEAVRTEKHGESGTIKRVEVFRTPQRVKIVLVPKPDFTKSAELIDVVRSYLEPRRLVGTFFIVSMAVYTSVSLKISFTCKSYAAFQTVQVKNTVNEKVRDYFDPFTGGPDSAGWPYNRDLTVYELFHLIEKIEGVDHVVWIELWDNIKWVLFDQLLPIAGLIDLKELYMEILEEE